MPRPKTEPFPKGPPDYHFRCPVITAVETVVRQIGSRVERCLHNQCALTYTVFCGDARTGQFMMLLMEGRGLKPTATLRSDWKGKRRDKKGVGPVITGTISVAALGLALHNIGPKARPGAVLVKAQPAIVTPSVAGGAPAVKFMPAAKSSVEKPPVK